MEGSIALGADHAGRELKALIKEHLAAKSLNPVDFGVDDGVEKADYPAIAAKVAEAVSQKRCQRGILICGTGVGMSIAANREPGIRAANCSSEFVASLSRAHNDANVLCLGQRVLGAGLALAIVDAFLDTAFEGGRHQVRVDMMG
ncbi:MAG: ribose 5-phosphate isomerase B [Deltaproteobacteria bacterium]|jgi:ribose 5-phosphate isomerase B|nr:ribose 5-phosphate isomerase B [Deltaproteobacteria bacterium]